MGSCVFILSVENMSQPMVTFVTMDVSGIHFQQLIFLSAKPINPLKLYFPSAHQSWTSRHMYLGWKDSMLAFFRDVASLGSIELISVDSGCIPPLKWRCGETNWFSCSKPPEVIDLMLSDLVFPQWNEDDRLVNKLKKQVLCVGSVGRVWKRS